MRHILLDLRFFMNGVLAVKRTVFFELKFFLSVPSIFAGCVIAALAFAALQSNKLNNLFFTCHNIPPSYRKEAIIPFR